MSERAKPEMSARQLGKLVLRAAPILGAGLVLAAACRGNEEVTHTPEDKNVPVTECLPEVTPIFESSDGHFDDNALDVGFLGDFVHPKVQEILEKYGACRYPTKASGEDDPSNLFIVQGIEVRDPLLGDLQKQVEAGNLLSVNLVPFGSTESRNIYDFECDPSKIENLIDDGKGYDANRIGLKLSSGILTDDLVDIFEEEQICVLPGLSLRPNSFGVQVKGSERDEVIDRFEEEMGEGVEEVRKVPITKFE